MLTPQEKALESIGMTVSETLTDEVIESDAYESDVEEVTETEETEEVTDTEVEETEEVESEEQDVVETEETQEDEDSFGEFVDTTEESEESAESIEPVDLVSVYNEKFGTEYESIEDIHEASNKSDTHPIASSVDKFMKANPDANIVDFVNIMAVDYDKVAPSEIIIQKYMSEGMSADDAKLIYESRFGEEEIDEDLLDESDVAKLKKQNRIRKIEENKIASEIRSEKKSLREQYAASMESYKPSEKQSSKAITKEAKDAWKKMADESIKSLETFEIPLADGKAYKFSNKEFLTKNKAEISDPEKAWNFLKTEDGSWDVSKLNKLRVLDQNFEKVAKALFTQGKGVGQKETVNRGKNLSYDNTRKKNVKVEDNTYEKSAMDILQRGRNNGLSIKF